MGRCFGSKANTGSTGSIESVAVCVMGVRLGTYCLSKLEMSHYRSVATLNASLFTTYGIFLTSPP